MRQDMSKVVTERPRVGMRVKAPKGEGKQKQRLRNKDYEDSPKREKIRRKWKSGWWDCKEFTDVLGPLRGYLLKQVGRKWDDVYSEICKTLPAKTLQGKHIRDHIDWMVCKHVQIIDGVPCDGEGGMSYGLPLQGSKYFELVYVDPRDGILKKTPEREARRYKKSFNPDVIKVDEKIQMHKIGGIWYEIKVKKVNPDHYKREYKIPLGRRKHSYFTSTHFRMVDSVMGTTYVNEYEWKEVYQGNYLAISKKQLNSKELKKHDLHNDIALAA